MVKTIGKKEVTESVLLDGLSSNPTPEEGKLYYNNVSKNLYVYNGSGWQELGVGETYNSLWYLSVTGYNVYDDFEGYIAGPLTTNNKWTVDISGGGAVTINASTNAGGSGQEMLIYAGAGNGQTRSCFVDTNIDFQEGKNYWARLWFRLTGDTSTSGTVTDRIQFRINGGSWITVDEDSGTAADHDVAFPSSLLIYQNSGGLYDVYLGGKKYYSDQASVTSFGFQCYGNCSFISPGAPYSRAYVYIDDVRWCDPEEIPGPFPPSPDGQPTKQGQFPDEVTPPQFSSYSLDAIWKSPVLISAANPLYLGNSFQDADTTWSLPAGAYDSWASNQMGWKQGANGGQLTMTMRSIDNVGAGTNVYKLQSILYGTLSADFVPTTDYDIDDIRYQVGGTTPDPTAWAGMTTLPGTPWPNLRDDTYGTYYQIDNGGGVANLNIYCMVKLSNITGYGDSIRLRYCIHNGWNAYDGVSRAYVWNFDTTGWDTMKTRTANSNEGNTYYLAWVNDIRRTADTIYCNSSGEMYFMFQNEGYSSQDRWPTYLRMCEFNMQGGYSTPQ